MVEIFVQDAVPEAEKDAAPDNAFTSGTIVRADVTVSTKISKHTNSLRILSRVGYALVKKHLTAGNHMQWNRVFLQQCNEICVA